MKYSGIILILLTLAVSIVSSVSCREAAGLHEQSEDRKMALKNGATQIAGLTDENLRSYLHYYSPVILKQAHEYDSDHRGYDWITNFNYDQDNYLANNKENWAKELNNYVNNAKHTQWQIRPTLYTGIILFHDNSLNTNSIILLYHVYHARQRSSIHDWERIEIRVDNVTGVAGTGEEINYVVVTRHSLHNAREYPHDDLNFMTTDYGKHVLVWQADWDTNPSNPSQAELHFVKDSWSDIENITNNDGAARVDIDNVGSTRFHYVFVDEADPQASAYWNAQQLNSTNAYNLTSGKKESETVAFSETKRISYELQDLADIIPTHLNTSDWKKALTVNIVTPILNETNQPEVAAGAHTFYYTALDIENKDESRKGYIRKHWFWGVYVYAVEGDKFYDKLGDQPWYQHLYFAHNGTRGNGTVDDELANRGIFLGKDQYINWNTLDGGFDGRWVQLFND